MIRVVLVDAERSLHQGVSMRIETEADLQVVGKADNLASATRVLAIARPDIILLDPAGLNHEPAAVVGGLLRAHPESRVVVLSLDDDPESRDRMLAAGASAFVSKHNGSEKLPEVLRRVIKVP